MQTLDQHIEVDPAVAGGKPHIAGHRITVNNIVIWCDRLGKTPDEIAGEYGISLSDVHAAPAYYFDHREQIDQSIAVSDAFVEDLRRQTPSKLPGKLQSHSRHESQD